MNNERIETKFLKTDFLQINNSSNKLTLLNNLDISGDLTVSGTLRYNEIIDTTVTGNISGYTGIFEQLYANNFVYNTGDQTISGNKTFLDNLNISGDLTVAGTIKYNEVIDITTTGDISGYTGYFEKLYADNLVYNTGNQNIGGNKTFTGTTTFSGQEVNLVDTALNLSGVGDMTFSGTNINFINSPVFISGTNLRVQGDTIANNLVYNTGDQTISGVKTFANSGIFNSGIGLNNSKLINAVPEFINETDNFIISGNDNSRMILANSNTQITGTIVVEMLVDSILQLFKLAQVKFKLQDLELE